MILVGPNGIGKSSVINIVYFFITRQWSRLLEYKFSEIIIRVDGTDIQAVRSDISGLSSLKKIISGKTAGSRVSLMLERLSELNLLEDFASKERLTTSDRARFSSILSIPADEVHHFHRFALRRLLSDDADAPLFMRPRVNLESMLKEAFPCRTIYLPTYRRIEKDLGEIFPDFEERYRSHISSDLSTTTGRSSSHYIDLVSFGMEDVKQNFVKKTQEMRDYSLAQYNNLSGLYLRDVIRGKADQFTSKQINDLKDEDINSILDRVTEETLPSGDKNLLREKIKALQGKKKSEIDNHDKFLAHYFNRLVTTNADINNKEKDIASFVNVCNAYLKPSKRMIYDEIAFKIQVLDDRNNELDLSVLSSGEKQVVSLFSHLYLDDTTGQIVVIDEPELSLSVPWQKRFLTDIFDSKKCSFIFAVTHSPFIYQNELRSGALDLRRHTRITEAN